MTTAIQNDELAEMRAGEDAQAQEVEAAYLKAVVRSADGNPLPLAERLAIVAAVGKTSEEFVAAVKLEKERRVATVTTGKKSSLQAELTAAEQEQKQTSIRHSDELHELHEQQAAEAAPIAARIRDLRNALDEVKAAEEFLERTGPRKPILAKITRIDPMRGFISMFSKQTSPQGTDFYQRDGVLTGFSFSQFEVGQQVELHTIQTPQGKRLAVLRIVEDADVAAA